MTKTYDSSSGMWLPTPTPAPQAQTLATVDYSPEAVKRLCFESLVDMVHNAKGDIKTLAAVNACLDRLEGKPMQRSEARVEVKQVTMSPAELLRRVQFVQRAARYNAIDITPPVA
jgi:hypothetical protein